MKGLRKGSCRRNPSALNACASLCDRRTQGAAAAAQRGGTRLSLQSAAIARAKAAAQRPDVIYTALHRGIRLQQPCDRRHAGGYQVTNPCSPQAAPSWRKSWGPSPAADRKTGTTEHGGAPAASAQDTPPGAQAATHRRGHCAGGRSTRSKAEPPVPGAQQLAAAEVPSPHTPA